MANFEISSDSSDQGSVELPTSRQSPCEIKCTKLNLDESFAAYLEKRVLIRETESVECDPGLMEKVFGNYVIVRKILSNLSWQDKILCKHVCSMWHSVVQTLKKDQLEPVDFLINMNYRAIRRGVIFKMSGVVYNEPMVVMTFTNSSGFTTTSKCEALVPSPCSPPCDKEHALVDMINHFVCAPKECMFTVRASHIYSLPLLSNTNERSMYEHGVMDSSPLLGGVCIPALPNVEFKMIKLGNIQEQFYDVVDSISSHRTIKGVLVYVTENYLFHSVEDIVFLNHFKIVQPTIPYALGGCIVEDTVHEHQNLDRIVDGANHGTEFYSDNLITMGIFSIPKNMEAPNEGGCHFEMFSTVLESSEWTKEKIEECVNDFAKKVPRFECCVVLKLSCVGRSKRHQNEYESVRAAFPNARIFGCYGNGELGVNHPERQRPDAFGRPPKRHRRDPGPQYGVMYSYATVLLYIGWGKILAPAESP